MERKTIEQILAIEPKIQTVLDKAKAGYKEGFDDWRLYSDCKNDTERLSGWGADKEALQNSDDYSTVINAIADILNL